MTFAPFTFPNELQYFQSILIVFIALPHILRVNMLQPLHLNLFTLISLGYFFKVKSKFMNTKQENCSFIFLIFVYGVIPNRGNRLYFFYLLNLSFRHVVFVIHDSYDISHHHWSIHGPLFLHSHLHKFID